MFRLTLATCGLTTDGAVLTGGLAEMGTVGWSGARGYGRRRELSLTYSFICGLGSGRNSLATMHNALRKSCEALQGIWTLGVGEGRSGRTEPVRRTAGACGLVTKGAGLGQCRRLPCHSLSKFWRMAVASGMSLGADYRHG